ncbi:MAG: PQQ-binding-like beta-propeller repeat protein [Pirellulales bacterium]|nr:PQQ-binding-like beta-propeller repeat protein [Pirellulales bacterium]
MRTLKVPAAGFWRFLATLNVALILALALTSSAVAQTEAPKAKAPKAAAKAAEGAKPPAAPLEVDPMDWPNWRGPQQNSTSAETGLVEKWNPKEGPGSNLIWKRSDLGTRSTPIVMRGNLYVLVRHNPGTETECEKVVCVNAATGEQKWQYPFNVYLSDVPDTRVGWSNVVGDPTTGHVYAQGVNGYFCCLEGDTGKVVWDHHLMEEFGTISTYGGRTNNPVVFDDLVLISAILVGWGDTPQFDVMAKPAHRFLAFDKATGELRWLAGTTLGPPDTNYATPVTKVIGGEAQLVIGGADGKLWGFQPRTGKALWNFPLSRRSINASPLVVGTTVYGGHSEENLVGSTQGSVVAVDATLRGDLAGKEKWQQYTLMAGRSSPVMVDDKLWVVTDGAKLQILDPETGEQIGRKALGTIMRSTPVFADGKVYLCTNSGIWYALKPKGAGVEVLQRVRLGNGEQNDGSPIVSHGRIYLPTSDAIYCIGDKDAKPEIGELPPEEQELPVAQDEAPATVLVSPYDALLKPGGTQKFTVRLYNARGQFLRIAKPEEVTFRVDGPGEVAADGTFTAAKRGGHAGALVFAKVGDLESKARARIVPPLPWTFDFNKVDNLPISWIGGRVRYIIEEIEGEKVVKKVDVLPTPEEPNNTKGTRSQLFMGPTDLQNYTIQGDFRLAEKNRLPDCGLINSGYTLVIRSGDQRLRMYSWTSHDHRTSAEVPLEVQPGVWYRLKLQVKQAGDNAEVKGKVWLRDQQEPADWTVEMVDSSPVRSGSPGVYGHSQEAPFYMDNLTVTPNE